jgi:hypothetical protein
MLPTGARYAEVICFDFESVSHPRLHGLDRPQGRSRPFYELPHGEARYFGETDELYLCYADRLRTICRRTAGCASFSLLEAEPRNRWIASHLLFTISLLEILKRRSLYSLHAAGLEANG